MEALRYEKALSLHMLLLVWDSDFLDCIVLAEVHNLTHPTTSYKYSTHVTLFEGQKNLGTSHYYTVLIELLLQIPSKLIMKPK